MPSAPGILVPIRKAQTRDGRMTSDNESRQLRSPGPIMLRTSRPGRTLGWYDYAEMWLPSKLGRVLDYGCGTGEFLSRLVARGAKCVGVDIDRARVAEVAQKLPTVTTAALGPTDEVPFASESFDLVVILEVIEHVADERRVLSELARVLVPGGTLLLTTPHRGLLTFLDPGNFKFVAPGIHRWIHRNLLRRGAYYDQRFGQARLNEHGMIADFTTDQIPWHRHYRYEQIRALAPSGLKTIGFASYFPAFRALWSLKLALQVLTRGRLRNLPFPLAQLNRRLSRVESRWGDQLVVVFRKEPSILCG